jgi:hypothetical protein
MVFGEERLFIIEYPPDPQGIMEFILRFMGPDQNGLKMKGNFPRIWTDEAGKADGPLLYDEDNVYEVISFDYDNHLIWLRQTANARTQD